RQPRGVLHVLEGPVRLRRLSRARRPLPAPGARAQHGQARVPAPPDPAAHHRPGDVHPGHGLPHAARRGAAHGRACPRPDALGAVPGPGGNAPQGAVTGRSAMLGPAALAIGLVLLLLTGRPASGAETGSPTITLTLADSGTAVDLPVGDRLVLQL